MKQGCKLIPGMNFSRNKSLLLCHRENFFYERSTTLRPLAVWLIDTERSRSSLGTFVSNPDRDGKEGRREGLCTTDVRPAQRGSPARRLLFYSSYSGGGNGLTIAEQIPPSPPHLQPISARGDILILPAIHHRRGGEEKREEKRREIWCGAKAAGSGRGRGAHKAKGYSPARRRRAHPMGSGARRCPAAAASPARRGGLGGGAGRAGAAASSPRCRAPGGAAGPAARDCTIGLGRERRGKEGGTGGGSGARPPRRAAGAPRAPPGGEPEPPGAGHGAHPPTWAVEPPASVRANGESPLETPGHKARRLSRPGEPEGMSQHLLLRWHERSGLGSPNANNSYLNIIRDTESVGQSPGCRKDFGVALQH